MNCAQFVDIEVTKAKYENELDKFRQMIEMNRRRGIILLDASYPNVFLAFTAVKLNPSPIVFAVRVNYQNYDLEPLSLRFVNPHTLEPIELKNEIGSQFLRKIPGQPQPQALLQQNRGKLPFLCIPGVREYHKHSAHTGDSWLLHRSNGEGSLGFLVEKLYEYGISAISTYQLPAMNFSGLPIAVNLNVIPE